ncbi:aminopeptidase P family protein [Echinicola strongylocentroti]|uniref:Xaa-Pro aminopeptidase n=1 Tax=Echinicola strongylocentroti TaxID=1795355 RepID=A0A2Z4IGD0_9BACT|nr:aminopeptidase P family protein [Echinicola strongylocentroti]AWW29730.1 aminopeptidase P family protein [Echinicola strongylocentroti]
MFKKEIYQERRAKLRAEMGKGQLLFLGNDEASINFDHNWYPFRQDSTFLYYFGISLPGLVGVIDCDADKDYIFGDDYEIDDIVWTGPQPTIAELGEQVGVVNTAPLRKLADFIKADCHILPPYRGEHVLKLRELLGKSIEEVESMPSVKLIQAVAKQRNIKSSEELAEMDEAVSRTSAVHLAVMKAARAGMKEYELVAVATSVARSYNASLSFPPIATINGQTLHNHYYGNTLKEGDIMLFDSGAESTEFYAGDMTRTFPVSGKFDARQRELYEIVYNAHRAAVESLRPGKRFLDVHLLAAETLVEGLKGVGLMKGDAKEAVAAGAHTMFFQCGLGHMMGLDVHDMENLGEQYVGYTPELKKSSEFGLKSLRLGKALESNNVITVEPGIYIIPELIDMYKAEGKFKDFIDYNKLDTYRDFGGIRVEEDFVITDSGADLLGTPLPIAPDEVEKVRKEALS